MGLKNCFKNKLRLILYIVRWREEIVAEFFREIMLTKVKKYGHPKYTINEILKTHKTLTYAIYCYSTSMSTVIGDQYNDNNDDDNNNSNNNNNLNNIWDFISSQINK